MPRRTRGCDGCVRKERRNDRLGCGDDIQHRLAVFLIQVLNVLVHDLEILRVPFPQLFAGDGIVIDLGGPLRRRLVNVPAQPDGLDDNPNVLVVLQRQRREILDARVVKEDRRQRKDIHLAGLQCFLGLVLFRRARRSGDKSSMENHNPLERRAAVGQGLANATPETETDRRNFGGIHQVRF